MLLGENELRKIFIGLDENQYQPNSVDLKLDKVFEIKDSLLHYCGLYNDTKFLPNYEEVTYDGFIDGYFLKPKKSYIVTIDGKMNIPENVAQFYLPRSSLLRCGLSLHTALGDSGFNGTLSFLITNNTDYEIVLGKGERIATAVNFRVIGATKYDGDYNEE